MCRHVSAHEPISAATHLQHHATGGRVEVDTSRYYHVGPHQQSCRTETAGCRFLQATCRSQCYGTGGRHVRGALRCATYHNNVPVVSLTPAEWQAALANRFAAQALACAHLPASRPCRPDRLPQMLQQVGVTTLNRQADIFARQSDEHASGGGRYLDQSNRREGTAKLPPPSRTLQSIERCAVFHSTVTQECDAQLCSEL